MLGTELVCHHLRNFKSTTNLTAHFDEKESSLFVSFGEKDQGYLSLWGQKPGFYSPEPHVYIHKSKTKVQERGRGGITQVFPTLLPRLKVPLTRYTGGAT